MYLIIRDKISLIIFYQKIKINSKSMIASLHQYKYFLLKQKNIEDITYKHGIYSIDSENGS